MNWITCSAALLALAVGLGAFGAHGLKDILGEYTHVYEKAVFYHFVHALGILLISCLPAGSIDSTQVSRVNLLLLVGVILFSGSLYALSVTKIRWLGAITPFGGTAFIIAWILLAYYAWRAA